MASIKIARIYPKSITPKFTSRNSDYEIQSLSTHPSASWNNVCSGDYGEDSVICWGDKNPDAVDRNNPVYSSNFYNTITTASGSFNTPTPFTTNGWSDNNIPASAKIKKIDVEYAWDQVIYTRNNNCVTWAGKDCVGNYDSAGGYFKRAPQITLSIAGKNLTVSGPNVNSSSSCTYKNEYNYTEAELRSCGVNIPGVSGLRGSDLANAQITFTPGKNYASDVARIVMRHIRLYVEYEDTPAAFVIESASLSSQSISNCPDEKVTLNINLKNESETKGKTHVRLSGAGITNAEISGKQPANNDILKQNDNDYIWEIKDDCYNRNLRIDLAYNSNIQAGDYDINIKVQSYQGSKNIEKNLKLSIQSCKPIFTFDIVDTQGNIVTKREFIDTDETQVYLRLKLQKNQILSDHKENLQFNASDLISSSIWGSSSWEITTKSGSHNIQVNEQNNIYTFTNITNHEEVTIKKRITLDDSGTYRLIGKYNNTTKSSWSQSKTQVITVKGTYLETDYFKLRLEDGSDVKYNSLMVTQGDDLLEPLTYTTEELDKYVSKMHIYGETKRIPVNEVRYVYFTIDLDTEEDIELQNVLTYIDIYDAEYKSDNILVGVGKGATLLEVNDEYICSIHSISSKQSNTIKLAVRSKDEIEDVIIKIKPYNYDGYKNDEWIPSHVMFKDIPNIKIGIQGISDIIYDESETDAPESHFTLTYTIQNLSDVPAKNVRFQLDEPSAFKKESNTTFTGDNNSWFNKNNRIITFPLLEANSGEKVLSVSYQATRKGLYDFVIRTLDNPKTLEDDQYENSYTHNVMVNIPNDVVITTDVNKTTPHVNELIDFHIQVKNLHKRQDTFKFDIYDIGKYDNEHEKNDYQIEYVKCKNGIFTPSESYNKIGEWILEDINIDDEYHLTLTMRPQDIGHHVLKTIFVDQFGNARDFYNEIRVIERDKQLEFNVYHAVSDDENANCNDCDNLIKICDDDFINLGDDIFYVFEIKNNSRNPIQNTLHIYARLPESFLTNKILCSSRNYFLNQDNNLISFSIPFLHGCKHEDSTIKFCIKIQPSEIGKFVSNFSLSTRNSSVLYKQLKLTVDTEFNERKLEHEISIYNFDKTNKYYRYEIDNVGNIFKFFNTGDKTLRPIEIEEYKKSAIETYTGTNLKDITNQIKDKSKYVDPLFLRTGNNKLADKGYELFPDGFIRRFGLLNSEVYHYTGQLPIVTDLVDRAMKWDIDDWDTKLWAGDIYDNGVFGLTIDYAKIPTNFNILDTENPIKNLQELVDNVKPYGTKAICHYSATVRANIQIHIEKVVAKIKHDINVRLKFPEDLTIISSYNRYDSTIAIYHDLARIKINMEVKRLISRIKNKEKEKNQITSKVDKVYSRIFADKITKKSIQECYDLITYIYSASEEKKNIDIIKPFNTEHYETSNISLSSIQVLNFKNNINDKEEIGFTIKPSANTQIYTYDNIDDTNNIKDNIIKCIFYRDDINDFIGFKFILNNEVVQKRYIDSSVSDISIQIQTCLENGKNILHFWGSINKEHYYHIGFLILNDFKEPVLAIINENDREIDNYSIDSTHDTDITFKISDKIHIINQKPDIIYGIENKNKWQFLDNINKNGNKYAFFENNINIDKECESRKINVPKLALKYSDIDIEDFDEITDIKFKIEAQSNKENFADDININIYKNGDKYIPDNNIAREMIYPSTVSNINQDFITTFDLEQNNITVCSQCLKTSLGHNSVCPYCGSGYVVYSDKKTPATACYNCGWIIDGWNNYCTHCLSYDIERIQIDYNKTYCNDCGTLSPDYYQKCPKCFSSNVMHLTNRTHRYQIFGENRQNIEPITMYTDTDESYIDIFSLYIPFNKETEELKDLEYLTLKIHGTNHNTGKYYYCEACGSADIGNYEKCPYCNSNLIANYALSNYALRPFYHSADDNMLYEDMVPANTYNAGINSGEFVKEIDLLTCAHYNSMDKFQLTFRIENQIYEKIREEVSKLPARDDYKVDILDNILSYNITIDNLSLDYRYNDEYEWVNLDNMEGLNHTGILYKIPEDIIDTDKINFKFDIEKKTYKHAYLYIAGFLKNIDYDATMVIEIVNSNTISRKEIKISDTLFKYKYDILKDIKSNVEDLSIRISFHDAKKDGEIIITDCNIITETSQKINELHDNINDISSEFVYQHNEYLFKSLRNNLWGLNDTQPYYLSGKQLETNLISYIDFGKLDLEEYIRIYNIHMIISYKSKNGKIVTETISSPTLNNSFKAILQGAGYSPEEIESLNPDTKLTTALSAKNIQIDNSRIEQLLSADIIGQNSTIWGNTNIREEVLNNLEVESTNIINEDDELVNDIPLHYQIAQAFNTGDNIITNISRIYLDYFGKRGYPSDLISIYICKDNDGKPGNIIASTKTQTSNIATVLNVDLDVTNLYPNTQYWIIVEDVNANKNNYHRFGYNYNPEKNNLIGEFITYQNKRYTHQNCVLSFKIERSKKHKVYHQLPTTWVFNTEQTKNQSSTENLDLEEFSGYTIHNNFYRYNIQEGNNISLSNLNIKTGYNLWST